MPRALLSVHDKTGLVELGQSLSLLGWDLVASGGTAQVLAHAHIPVTAVDQVTHHAEMLDGRVKTLHPAIHSGILARDTDEDMAALRDHGYAPITMVVCNLSPFQQTVAHLEVTLEEAVEQIDVGGVTLLRAGAKNFARVTVLSDPADYQRVLAMLRATGRIDLPTRRALAIKAFEQTRDYDTAIHAYLSALPDQQEPATPELPATFSLSLVQEQPLRYGENPHQQAALYTNQSGSGPLGGTVLSGKSLTYNNILDFDAAWRAVELFDRPTVVILKHLSPCGIASAATPAEAFRAALASDPDTASGGVIAVNCPVDEAFVGALADLFLEGIAAPGFTPGAQQMIQSKRKSCRLLRMEPVHPSPYELRSVRGGVLIEQPDRGDPAKTEWRVVSRRSPTAAEVETLTFAWKAVQCVKSNAIVLAVNEATIGIGGGVPNRLDATRIAVGKAGARARGGVMASDAFFPLVDAVEMALAAGVTAIVSPGGSIRESQIITTADAAGATLIFTGIRHVRY